MRGDSEAQAASPEARPPSPCLGRPAVAVHEKEIVSVEGAHTLHTYGFTASFETPAQAAFSMSSGLRLSRVTHSSIRGPTRPSSTCPAPPCGAPSARGKRDARAGCLCRRAPRRASSAARRRSASAAPAGTAAPSMRLAEKLRPLPPVERDAQPPARTAPRRHLMPPLRWQVEDVPRMQPALQYPKRPAGRTRVRQVGRREGGAELVQTAWTRGSVDYW